MNMDYCGLMRIRHRHRHHHHSNGENIDFLTFVLLFVGFMFICMAVRTRRYVSSIPLIAAWDKKLGRFALKVIFSILGIIFLIAGSISMFKTITKSSTLSMWI